MLKIDGLIIGLGRSIKAIGAESAAFKAIASGANASNRALEKASLSAAALARHLTAIGAGSAAMGALPMFTPGGGGRGVPGNNFGGGGGGGHGGGRGVFGAYQHGGNIHLGPGGIGLGTVGIAAGGAFLPLAATAAGIYGAHSVYESTKGLDTERARFKLYGMSSAVNDDAFKFVDSMASYGVSRTERMRLFREAQGVFRESGMGGSEAISSAKKAMPAMTALSLLMSTMTDEGKAGAHRHQLSALRFAEMSGGNASQAELNKWLDVGFKLSQSSGGQVNFEGLRQFKARASSAGFNITPDALAALEPIMGELTGSTTGTGLRVARNRLVGLVRIPNQAAHALVESGLWNKDKVEFNSQGGIKKMGMNGPLSAEHAQLFDNDPGAFYTSVLRPMYEKMKLDTVGITRMNALIFGGATGSSLFGLIEKQIEVIAKSREALKVQVGMFQGADMVKKTITGEEKELGAAWEDFKTALSAVPALSGLLKGMTSIIRTIGGSQPGERTFTAKAKELLTGESLLSAITGKPLPSAAGAARGFINNTIVMPNGRVLAEIVSNAIEQEARRPQTGGARFDGRRDLAPAGGATGGW